MMRTLLSLTSSPIDPSYFSLKRSTAALKSLDGGFEVIAGVL
jgi:hypothetical protein